MTMTLDLPATRRAALLHGPILPSLIRLAAPTVAVLLAQTLVAVAETYWTSRLGTGALAGVALVFPILTLVTTMSNGGIGGGVSSAIARAVGSGRREEAEALLWHALALAIGFGMLFTVGALVGGPSLYAAMGGRGEALTAALRYSDWVFAGSIPLWVVNLLASALRGAGEVRLPALVSLVGAAILVMLSPILIFGLGPLPPLGLAGAGVAVSLYYTGAMVVMLRALRRGIGALRLRPAQLRRRLFGAILGVGLVSAAGALMSSATTLAVTGAVGLAGITALAGYGVASRLDYLLIPLLFGLGTAVVTLVGMATGAGDHARADRIAWIAAALAVAFSEAIGLTVTILPQSWMGLFTNDTAVMAIGAHYLQRVAPFYGAVGLGMVLYFACQGRGRMAWPFAASVTRLSVAAGLGWFLTRRGGGLDGLFTLVATAAFLFGLLNAIGMILSSRGVERVSAAGENRP